MYAVTQQLLAVLDLQEADIGKPAVLPGTDTWGFDQTPSLNQLEDRACRRVAALQPSLDEPCNSYAEPGSYVASLESSHAFASNHCVQAMADAYGISEITNALSGSVLGGLADSASASAAVQAIRQQVDSAWSTEAVRRGVVCAKSGDYQQALECYNKALALNPNNCDACVARGAAFANQKQFEAAIAEFEAAIRLNPSNANAAKYLSATKQHMQVAGDAADAQGRPGHAAAAPSSNHQQHKQQEEQHKKHQHGRNSPGQHPHRKQQQQPPSTQEALTSDKVPIHTDQQQRHHQTYDSTHSQQDHRELSRRQRQHSSVPDNYTEFRQPEHKRHHSRSRSRSRHTRQRSCSSSRSRSRSSDSNSSSSGNEGDGHQLLKAPTAADIKRAIELVRSANKEGKKDRRKGSSRGKNKKRKHKHKHRKKNKA